MVTLVDEYETGDTAWREKNFEQAQEILTNVKHQSKESASQCQGESRSPLIDVFHIAAKVLALIFFIRVN